MNVENIKRVRDHIAAVEARRFDMAAWAASGQRGDARRADVDAWELAHDCNTCGCIGGWTEALLREDAADETPARELLGLDYMEAEELFYAHGWELGLRAITQTQAVAVLDHLMATGEVDWTVAPAAEGSDPEVVAEGHAHMAGSGSAS